MTLFDRAPAALPPISDELILTGVACRVMDGGQQRLEQDSDQREP